MMEQFSSQKQQESNREFEYIILDTRTAIERLRRRMERLRNLDADEDKILEIIIQSIAFNRSAEIELDYNCLDIVSQYLGHAYSDDVTDIAKAMSIFGKTILEDLRQLGAYKNGYLFYQFFKMLGPDVILVKLVPPEIK